MELWNTSARCGPAVLGLSGINWFWVIAVLEIAFLACVFYFTFRFFRGTRSAQMLIGLATILLFLFALTSIFDFDALNWLLQKLSVYLAIGFVIVFQPEIRGALAELGKRHVFTSPDTKRAVVDQVVQAVAFLAERRIGALIAFEREIGTRAIQDTGVAVDSRVEAGLLASIFFPHAPLHDGGAIISGERIVAASCLFPLSQRPELSKTLGTRHRAALGLTEETDAVVLVVSEETGTVSLAYRARLSQDVELERLRRFLSRVLTMGEKPKSAWQRARELLGPTPDGTAGLKQATQAEHDTEWPDE